MEINLIDGKYKIFTKENPVDIKIYRDVDKIFDLEKSISDFNDKHKQRIERVVRYLSNLDTTKLSYHDVFYLIEAKNILNDILED